MTGTVNKLEFRGNPWLLIEIIGGILLIVIIIFGEPSESHYFLFAGDLIALGFEIVDRIKNEYF